MTVDLAPVFDGAQAGDDGGAAAVALFENLMMPARRPKLGVPRPAARPGRGARRPTHSSSVSKRLLGCPDQPLGGETDHLAQNVGVGVFSTNARRFIISSVIEVPRLRCDSQPDPTGESPMTAASRSPLATAPWRARFASGLLPPCYTRWDKTDNSRQRRGIRS